MVKRRQLVLPLCVFALAAFTVMVGPASAQTYTVVYSFSGQADGAQAWGGLVRDPVGNLYGTTEEGGAFFGGALYKLTPSGQETVLYSFTGFDGLPIAGVTRDANGNFYGALYGSPNSVYGIVYKIDAAGNQTVLHRFTGGTDGANPNGTPAMDKSGNLYGCTNLGGTAGVGVLFRISPAGLYSLLHTFQGPEGRYPTAVIIDSAGSIYGTAWDGGRYPGSGFGTVFSLDTAGRFTILYSFKGGSDGANPVAVMRSPQGIFYGATRNGGASGNGTVFKLDAAGNETVLHSFMGEGDGAQPDSGVILDRAGNLYGTTVFGGTAGFGVVYQLDANGKETILHTFAGPPDGAGPIAGLTFDGSGTLYGTTQLGGIANWGTVFKLTP